MTDAGGAHRAIPIDYYTDPLCCWSWALEPVWRQLRQHHDVAITVVLGGMIESWDTYRDPMNDVNRAPQLAPLWHLASRTTGVRIDPEIWHVDPPRSSYPASIAAKAAALQSVEAGSRYLALVREAVMTRRLNVARPDVLCRLARELAIAMPGEFDADRFESDLAGDAAADAFRNDLARVRIERIGRFPTIVVHGSAESRIAVGYRTVEMLDAMIAAATGASSPSSAVGS